MSEDKKTGIIAEFREFIARGNVMDMAVGIAVGAAFTAIATSLVQNIIMPPLNLVLSGADFSGLYVIIDDPSDSAPYLNAEAAKAAGATLIEYGLFLQSIVSFLVIALAVFLLVRSVNRIKRKREEEVDPTPSDPRDRECPFCAMTIPRKAKRCPECTSHLDAPPAT